MTSKIGRFLFCVLVFVICSLPALVFLGVRESFVDLHGVEPKVEVPPLAVRSFADRTFQKAFEDEYARNFFLRKSLLKTRNTLCEYLNLGMFHEGYSHSILEGRHGVLYEMRYLRHHMKVLDSRSIRGNETTEMLKRVSLEFADKGIDFVVVLAPDKVSMYPEDIPTYSGMLGGLRSLDTQRAVTCFLEGQGITVLDAESFLCDRKADFSDRMFPIAGTHWNALASGLVVEELLRRISREGSRYHNGRFSGVQPSREVLYHDDDLGKLLNVWHSESLQKNVSLRPVFGKGI